MWPGRAAITRTGSLAGNRPHSAAGQARRHDRGGAKVNNANTPEDPAAGIVVPPISAQRQRLAAARRERWLRVGMIGFVAAFIVFGAVLWMTGRLEVKSLGYPAVWVISLIGAGSIVLPIPGLAAVCVGATPEFGLNPLLIGIIAASAEALGEMTGYLAGFGGNALIQKHRLYPRVRGWLLRRGSVPLFLLSVIPNPFFDLMGIAAGSIRYPVGKFVGIVFVGKTIKSTGIAYGCYFGVALVEELVKGVF